MIVSLILKKNTDCRRLIPEVETFSPTKTVPGTLWGDAEAVTSEAMGYFDSIISSYRGLR